MLYPRELIEEIRFQNDIVDVISQYVPLKQKGNSYFGICPFHHEKTPSFSVNSEKQFYYCFGCGAAGNVYGFLMQMEHCNFVDAVQKLADRANISLPEPELTPKAQEMERLKQRLFEMHKTAGRFYYDMLHSAKGEEALAYLGKREIQPNIQRKFGLGYAPEGRRVLYEHLSEQGFTSDEMVKSGLVMENKDGRGYHDRFYNRLMFPIFDVQGRVIGFGGRILGKGEPKYLNSPETILFNKSRNLYGLHLARKTRNKELILVEGYMDMISLYQAGFHNVAAALGTAFNQDHAAVLKKYVESVILLYDSDEAGTRAALRAIPILVKNGLAVRVIQVPDGKDPDEYIRHKGAQEFSKLLVNAEHYISFEVKCLQKNYNLENPQHKVEFTTEAAKILAGLDNAIEQDVYLAQVATMTNIEETAIRNEMEKMKTKQEEAFSKEAQRKRIQNYTEQSAAQFYHSKGIMEAQRSILSLWIAHKWIYDKMKHLLLPEDFLDPAYQKAAMLIGKWYQNEEAIVPADLMSYFEILEEQQKITAIFATKEEVENKYDMEKIINEGFRLIKHAGLEQKKQTVHSIEELQILNMEQRKLTQLYITILDG
jgi:DNA primase